MADPFVGEIKMYGFNWAPRSWALCNGAVLPISQNTTLFSLLGTQFGGDGRTTFALPDLRGRVPRHIDSDLGMRQGTKGGVETVTINQAEVPTHTHAFMASTETATGSNVTLDGTTTFAVADDVFYTSPSNVTQLSPQSSTSAGSGLSHENRQPSLGLNFCIALTGTYPSRN
ncbi:phage tail protein [Pleionea sp. CnH1-48]|uniref:phage tail protein n=1 Tax=Pleionea sp. CnH1-48 TaxID=2954494 RepID=UPI0020986157|nr:tail fiber protein [Pleionea sp. CnH1-48]MCO7227295.1 tail fiber protein [Pleionea sp. CnH1-48]